MSSVDDDPLELDAIEDPSEYNQRRRLQDIRDAYDRYFERKDAALDALAQGRANQQLARKLVREAVSDFVLECEWLIRDSEDAEADWWDGDGGEPLGAVHIPGEDRTITIRSLAEYLEFPDPYQARWVEQAPTPPGFGSHPEGETTVRSAEVQIPRRVSRRAFRRVTQFLHEVGLDAEAEEELPVFGFRELDEEEIRELRESDDGPPVDTRGMDLDDPTEDDDDGED